MIDYSLRKVKFDLFSDGVQRSLSKGVSSKSSMIASVSKIDLVFYLDILFLCTFL